MDGRAAMATSLLLALAGGCSTSNLRSGHCERDSDCLPGQSCVLQGAATFTCAGSDGGVPDGNRSEVAADVVPDVVAEVAPECVINTDCPSDKPICDLGSCRPCDASRLSDGTACAARDGTKPACGPTGSCVECTSPASADCNTDLTRPICDLPSNTCVKCSADDQCATKGVGPGICMSHQDGRCAAESEVIYVENSADCVSSALVSMAGSAGTPFCGPQLAVDALTVSRRLVVISGSVPGVQWAPVSGDDPVSLIGRAAAVIAPGTSVGVHVSGPAELYARDIIIRNSEQEGVIAESGATLRLDHITVDSNRGGGILVDSSAFEIQNTTVTGNGPAQAAGGVVWGGIRVQAPGTPASLELLTVRDNQSTGISCSGGVTGIGVFATGSAGGIDVTAACAIAPCSPAGPTCGAP
jgi:hypothetical protein